MLGVAGGIVGLLQPSIVDATQHSATGSFSENTVTVGSDLEVTLNVASHGGLASIAQTLPAGFTYLRSTIDPAENGQILTFILFGARTRISIPSPPLTRRGVRIFSQVL